MSNFAKDTLTNKRPIRRIRAYGGAIALLLVLNRIGTTCVYADDQPRADESNAIRRMNEQIQELQAKVMALEAKLNDVKGAPHGDVEAFLG